MNQTTHASFYNTADPKRLGIGDSGRDRIQSHRMALEGLLPDAKGIVFELGCGLNALGSLHPNYFGLDISFCAISESLDRQKLICGSMEELPLGDQSVDFVFSITALEHTPCPERVLAEICRILKPGGTAYLAPAWHCRWWVSKGLHLKPYHDLNLFERVQKVSIPLANSLICRAVVALLFRLTLEIRYLLSKRKPFPFYYRTLQPNLLEYIDTDSDAFSWMDPHAMILYFASRNYQIMNVASFWERLKVTHEPVVARKPRHAIAS